MTLPFIKEIAIVFFAFSLFVAWRANSNHRLGCMTFGYIALVVFILGMILSILTLWITLASVQDAKLLVTSGSLLSDVSGTNLAKFGALPVLWMTWGMYVTGFVLYAFECKMEKYFQLLQNIGVYFVLPVAMIGFEILLIYGLLFGNEAPLWGLIILLFFILMLGLAIVGYFALLIKKGSPKWTRTGVGAWSADWEEDEEFGVDGDPSVNDVERVKEPQQKKKMVPLNQEYLKDGKDNRKD